MAVCEVCFRHCDIAEGKTGACKARVGIEKNDNKVFMSIHGCHITAVFQDHNNTEVYGRVKEILIDSILRKNLAKI